MRTYDLTDDEIDEGNMLLSNFMDKSRVVAFNYYYEELMECLDKIDSIKSKEGHTFRSIIGFDSSVNILMYKDRKNTILVDTSRDYTIPLKGHEDKGYVESGTEVPVNRKTGIFIACIKFVNWYQINWHLFF